MSGEDRERAILQTAERLLAERSLHEISVDDLARGAGISGELLLLLRLQGGRAAGADGSPGRGGRRGVALAQLARDPPAVLREGPHRHARDSRNHSAVTLAAADARMLSAEVRELWARVMEAFVEETSAAIESERERGAAPPGIPARDFAIALNLMNERVFHAALARDSPAVGDQTILDTLVEVWLRAIYFDEHAERHRLTGPRGRPMLRPSVGRAHRSVPRPAGRPAAVAKRCGRLARAR